MCTVLYVIYAILFWPHTFIVRRLSERMEERW